jgi:hypothetical protein
VTGDTQALMGTRATYKLSKPFTPYQISELLYNFCSLRAPLSDAAQ